MNRTPAVLALVAASGTLACGPGAVDCSATPCDGSCHSVSDQVACCIEVNGRGLAEEATARLERYCTGNLCDASQYISLELATCAAQEYGLADGLDGFHGGFEFQGQYFAWFIGNTLDSTCTTAAEEEGNGAFVIVDATDGACEGQGLEYWSATCEDSP